MLEARIDDELTGVLEACTDEEARELDIEEDRDTDADDEELTTAFLLYVLNELIFQN